MQADSRSHFNFLIDYGYEEVQMRVYNFNPGPATLPLPVLEKVQSELLDWNHSGMSVMEVSHRSSQFMDMLAEVKANFRAISGLSDEHEVLFCQGGASQQFAMLPMNLAKTGVASYAVTGSFAKKAAAEAKKYTSVHIASDSSDRKFAYIPAISAADIAPNSSYLHICTNNTIYGTSYRDRIPQCGDVPLIADMSSNILSEPLDYNQFSMIYAGAQKNLGPSGLTILVIKKELLGEPAFAATPTMLQYKTFGDNDSLYNTPPTFAIYVTGLVLKWIGEMGGLQGVGEKNREKARLLYDALDASKLFKGTADAADRSIMNVTFVSADEQTDADFIKGATEKGLIGLKGHRAAGGMRASIYNAMPIDGVKALVAYIQEFEASR